MFSNLAGELECDYPNLSGYRQDYVPPDIIAKARSARMLVPERVRKSVIFVGRMDDRGEFIAHGTAFFLSCVTEGHRFSNLVTAAHVIRDIQFETSTISVRFNLQGGNRAYGQVDFSEWRFHEDADLNRHVDVAVSPVNMPFESDMEHIHLDLDGASDEVIEGKGIGPGEEVFLAGYFRYHYGESRNIPIIRVGSIAAMPEEPIKTQSGPMNGYLIEARSIGGLSGSPVFVHMAPWRVVNNRVIPTEGPQYYLLGLMKGHYDVRANDPADTVGSDVDRAEKLNTGIGIVVPVQDIIETVMQKELEDRRLRIVEEMKKCGEALSEDSDTKADEMDLEGRRDRILETMLNTPPDPKKTK